MQHEPDQPPEKIRPTGRQDLSEGTPIVKSAWSHVQTGPILLVVISVSILVGAVVFGLVARSTRGPVRRLTAAVEHVTDTKDFGPISIGYVAGDLASLAGAFNELLRSVSRTRERQSARRRRGPRVAHTAHQPDHERGAARLEPAG